MHSDANNVTRRFARQVRQVAVAAALAFASAAGAWNDFHFTSTNANAGPSTPAGGFTNVICYANGSLGPYNCGGTNYVAGNGMMFFSGEMGTIVFMATPSITVWAAMIPSKGGWAMIPWLARGEMIFTCLTGVMGKTQFSGQIRILDHLEPTRSFLGLGSLKRTWNSLATGIV